MENNGSKPKTFVSTFRVNLKPSGPCRAKEHTKNGLDNTDRAEKGNNKLGISSPPDAKPTPPQALEAPGFTQPLQDCTVCQGSDATFQGVIAGSRPVSVSWIHNDERVCSTKTSFQNGVARLALTQCSPGDAGVYTCVAENAAGKRSSSATLHVTGMETKGRQEVEEDESAEEQRPHNEERERDKERGREKEPVVEFLDPPEQVEVRVGERAKLLCEFSSTSAPVACCWIYNKDKVVVGGPQTSVSSSERQSSVEISQACPEDTGSYTVVVRNRRGSAQHTVSLSVIDRPDPPASHPVVSKLSSQSLVLSWTGPCFDGGTAVLGYIVEVREESSDEPGPWSKVTGCCKNTSYQVRSGLEPLGHYRFRVRAYNFAGISDPSEESNCVTMATTQPETEDPHSYVTVTIDTTHKVKDHYNVHEKLGVGKFGQVFRLSHIETGQVCAGKFYRGRTSRERTAARKEIELMNCLHHPRLVQCLAAYQTRPEMAMVMEYIAGGELFERIVDENFEHTEPTSSRYMQQILEGMQYVHKQNIVHLDLKPENIVCVDPTGTRLKIIDFGLASKLEDSTPLMVMHGTPEFVAPEVINYEPVGLETDMWSIGVICFILLSGESPFQGNSDAETLAQVTTAYYEFDEESFEDISDDAKDFIGSLLKKDRRCRLSCTEALAHRWMLSFTPLNRRATKSLNKEKMKRFLAKRKWKKTGKAVLALTRMALLSNRPNSPSGLTEEAGWSPEAEEAIQSLDKRLQSEPRFQQVLKDTARPQGAKAQLTCLIHGYPEPQVEWLQDGRPLEDSSRTTAEQHEDGLCSLVLADLRPSDSGVYVCRAINELGEALCSAKLTVEV
ncbi:myosin light chain kinase, smooth muscle-like [Genypterus blacodes]|uniref:myosin light chain kinase, smooth muscle-like n=1 Tax=Genypterus blacodes TaxID=154954 RepID=UPI003F7691A6